MSEKISVVIPTYNGEKYLKRTLDSVYKQTYAPFEIVLVDDGSTDGTIGFLEEYKQTHDDLNMHIIKQANKGAGAARNSGIRHAKGDWIAFLDSDDIWSKEKLQEVASVISSQQDACFITHNEYVTSEENIKDKSKWSLYDYHSKYQEGKDCFLQLYAGNFLSTSCITVKKDVLEKTGLFDESLLSAQDYDLWIRVGLVAEPIFIDRCLGIYVTRDGNITSNTYRRFCCEKKICYKYISNVISMCGRKKALLISYRRLLRILRTEGYISLHQKNFPVFTKIAFDTIPSLIELFQEYNRMDNDA